MNFNYDEFIDGTPEESFTLDLDKLKEAMPTYNKEGLCDMIVCERYFGYNEEAAIICMQELSRRRLAGDPFEFEKYIDNQLKKLPPIQFSIPDFESLLKSVKR